MEAQRESVVATDRRGQAVMDSQKSWASQVNYCQLLLLGLGVHRIQPLQGFIYQASRDFHNFCEAVSTCFLIID